MKGSLSHDASRKCFGAIVPHTPAFCAPNSCPCLGDCPEFLLSACTGCRSISFPGQVEEIEERRRRGVSVVVGYGLDHRQSCPPRRLQLRCFGCVVGPRSPIVPCLVNWPFSFASVESSLRTREQVTLGWPGISSSAVVGQQRPACVGVFCRETRLAMIKVLRKAGLVRIEAGALR